MRYHRIYKLIDPRHPSDHPRHIRYIGRTSRKLLEELDWLLSEWPKKGGPRRKWLMELLEAGVEPDIISIETVTSAKEAKKRVDHWILYCEGQGYNLINRELDSRFWRWDEQRVVEDFQLEVMRLLRGEESRYERAMEKLEEKGKKDGDLYAYLQAKEMPNLSLEEIPDLFREGDERVAGLGDKVLKAISSGEVGEPIASVLRGIIVGAKEAAERKAREEEGGKSAVEDYLEMLEEEG